VLFCVLTRRGEIKGSDSVGRHGRSYYGKGVCVVRNVKSLAGLNRLFLPWEKGDGDAGPSSGEKDANGDWMPFFLEKRDRCLNKRGREREERRLERGEGRIVSWDVGVFSEGGGGGLRSCGLPRV